MTQEHRDVLQRTVNELTRQYELQGKDLKETQENRLSLQMELSVAKEREITLEK